VREVATVSVCVCERERERETDRQTDRVHMCGRARERGRYERERWAQDVEHALRVHALRVHAVSGGAAYALLVCLCVCGCVCVCVAV
jgi:hypothetical protein